MQGGGERTGDRGEVGCKLTAGLDTRIKKLCESDKWVMYKQ